MVVSLSIVMAVFVSWYVGSERTIYYWDNSAYWMKTRGLADWLRLDIISAIKGVLHSIRYDEYNLLFAVPLSFATLLFGGSRLTYILSIYVLYFIPACMLLAVVVKNIIGNQWPVFIGNKWRYPAVLALVMLNPFMILPVLNGYSDVVGLIPVCLAILLYQKVRTTLRPSYLVGVGLLLLVATLLRRWYVFGSVGLILGIFIDQAYFNRTRPPARQIIIRVLKFSILPLTYGGLFLACCYPYVVQLITTDYVDRYKAYRFHDNYFELAGLIAQHYGAILFAMALAGVIGLVCARKTNRSLLCVIIVAQTFAFFAVGRVQSFDTHQYYLLTPGLLAGLIGLPLTIYYYAPEKYKKAFSAFAIVALCSVYLMSGLKLYDGSKVPSAFTNVSASPQRRHDIIELQKIYSDVEQQDYDGHNANGSVYVLACSFVFNVDLFRNIPLSTMSKSQTIKDNEYAPTAIFDVAQGFDTAFFRAEVVVDSNPVGYITTHKEEQQIITLLHDALQEGGSLRPYYGVVHQPYAIDNGYKVFVFRQISPVPTTVQNEIVRKIKATHPSVPVTGNVQ